MRIAFQLRQQKFDLAASPLALDEVVDHVHRPGAVERVQGGQLFDRVRLVAAQNVAHAARFKLEHARGERGVKHLFERLRVVERDHFDIKFLSPRVCSISLRQSLITVSVARPRKSILSRPIFSTDFMS